MRYRKLGNTGLEVSEIGYGTWGLGGGLWPGPAEETATAALRRAFELGVNFIDTALVYGEGRAERIVGDALRQTGLPVLVATKIPPRNRLWPARAGIAAREVFPYDHILDCTAQSLRNLGVERIDLQQLHVWNPEWLREDEWKRAFAHLKHSGQIRAAGVSVNDHQPETALDLVATGLIEAVQVIYNIFDPSAAERLFPLAQRQKTGVLARVPLDEGGLTGKITPETRFDPREFRRRYFHGDRARQVAERAAALAKDLGVKPDELPEIALRFCLSHPAVSSVMVGMRSRRHVERNCAISGKGPLPPETLAILGRHAWRRNFYEQE